MREKYEKQLQELNTAIIEMGNLIEVAISSAVYALVAQDGKKAEEVMKGDDVVDAKEKEIEQLCLRLLLQQQPVATDLRLVTAALKMVTDMERVGDHAEDIADLFTQMSRDDAESMDKLLDPSIRGHLQDMEREIQRMLKGSIDAYIKRDVDLARQIIASDDVVDDLYHNVKSELVTLIQTNSDKGEEIADYLLIAKYFERIGDHATNIAEWVIFAMTGELSS